MYTNDIENCSMAENCINVLTRIYIFILVSLPCPAPSLHFLMFDSLSLFDPSTRSKIVQSNSRIWLFCCILQEKQQNLLALCIFSTLWSCRYGCICAVSLFDYNSLFICVCVNAILWAVYMHVCAFFFSLIIPVCCTALEHIRVWDFFVVPRLLHVIFG